MRSEFILIYYGRALERPIILSRLINDDHKMI